jgi:hypothetical protein
LANARTAAGSSVVGLHGDEHVLRARGECDERGDARRLPRAVVLLDAREVAPDHDATLARHAQPGIARDEPPKREREKRVPRGP